MIAHDAPIRLGRRLEANKPEPRPGGRRRPPSGQKKNAGRYGGSDPIRRAGGLGFNSDLHRPAKAAVKHQSDFLATALCSHGATLPRIERLR